MSSEEQTEIIQEFIQEVRDLCEDLEPSILSLEEICKASAGLSEENIQTLHKIFRIFHSIKGGAGFLQFSNIVQAAHSAENLLDNLRTQKTLLIPRHIDLLCQACDFVKEALACVESEFDDSGVKDASQALITRFREEIASTEQSAAPTSPPASSAVKEPAPLEIDLDKPVAAVLNPESLKQFLQEGDDLIGQIEGDLLNWSKSPEDPNLVGDLFRNIHSLKGNCGFLGFGDLERMGHRMESILDVVRDGYELNRKKVADTFLRLLDIVKETIEDIGRGKSGNIDGLHLYLELLSDLLPKELRVDIVARPGEQAPRLGDILIAQGVVSPEDINAALEKQQKPLGELLVEAGAASEEDIQKALLAQQHARPPQASAAPAAEPATVSRQDIRVDLAKLDSLINLIGELVIAENMLIHNPDLEGLELENFNKAGQHMTKIVRELQEMSMTIRMMPVSGLFRRMLRLVHDLSRKSGKKVELQLVGEATEVDKTVIEKITDPLVHLIRNSMDHGLESPEERVAAGKGETGVIRLSASHEEGDVRIIIEDDGRGLNRGKILAKAISKGLAQGDGSDLSAREVFNFIFLPGFSTADKVTDVSGRGVGMDVVRQNLEQIKGKIEIQSSPGQGTAITLRIPLTLAIIEGMLIRTGATRYILPIIAIKESFRPTPGAITVTPDGEELVRVREHLLPVLRLHQLHRIQPDHEKLEDGILIIVESHGETICLFADELLGQQQTVIKALSDYITQLSEVRGVSGCTILGNGEVCMILDVRSLIDTRAAGC